MIDASQNKISFFDQFLGCAKRSGNSNRMVKLPHYRNVRAACGYVASCVASHEDVGRGGAARREDASRGGAARDDRTRTSSPWAASSGLFHEKSEILNQFCVVCGARNVGG